VWWWCTWQRAWAGYQCAEDHFLTLYDCQETLLSERCAAAPPWPEDERQLSIIGNDTNTYIEVCVCVCECVCVCVRV
jgi:hypothetical protein